MEQQLKEYAAVAENTTLRFTEAPGSTLDTVTRSRLTLAISKGTYTLTDRGTAYRLVPYGTDFYEIFSGEASLGFATTAIATELAGYSLQRAALQAFSEQASSFSAENTVYTLDGDGIVFLEGEEVGTVSRFVLQSADRTLTGAFRSLVLHTIGNGQDSFVYDDRTFFLSYDAATGLRSVRELTATRVWDSYASPSRAHPLGTDKNGMDVLTRLMYGGRVSLVIGFIVVLISGLLGTLLGGLAGYFGKWADEGIMRLVDVFYCIPTTPLLIILGALMDGMRLDPRVRMLYLMLILGLLGWPGIARLVRGQILSLREQEFMIAAEAVGLRPSRRIFRHLLPNVIPQLIVVCTMSLASTILTEATLSFLGLGVKFPFASWGNIMNDVSNVHVLTSYWFVWIPAGVCLVLAVLGFNFVGDGLRDAYDPKMKR
jgi:peptide/nickel transport system permease protein